MHNRHIHPLIYIALCTCAMMGLSGCTHQDETWRGYAERDERTALGIKDPTVLWMTEEVWENDSIPPHTVAEAPALITEREFYGDGQLKRLRKFRNGRLIEELSYELNDHAQLIYAETRGPDSLLLGISSTRYFPDGQTAEIQRFNGQKRLTDRTQYAYDNEHRLLKRTQLEYRRSGSEDLAYEKREREYVYTDDPDRYHIDYKGDGEWSMTEWYAYGRIDSTMMVNGYKTLYFYDVKGRLTGFETTDAKYGSMDKLDYVYDSLDRKVLEVAFYPGRAFAWSKRYRYDSLGNVVAIEERFKLAQEFGDSIFTNRFEYHYQGFDSLGAWLRMSESKNGRVYRRLRRKWSR